jgi:N-acetylglucosamine-6-sulfatase
VVEEIHELCHTRESSTSIAEGMPLPVSTARGAAGARRAACVLVLIVAVLCGVASSSAPALPRPAASAPNIVVILADDERWDTLDRIREVQRLIASHGVVFTNAFVTTSECCPSRASILTGQYAHHTGVIQNFGLASYPRFDEKSNLAVWLHQAGYDTALVGKYLNDYTVYGHHHIPPGWSDFVAMDSRPEEKYYDYTLNENGRLVHHGAAISDYSTDVLAEKAIAFVRRAKAPFFLYFAPITPHLPAIPAERDISTPLTLSNPRPDFDERDLSDKPWHGLYKRVYSTQALEYLDRDIEGRQLRSLRELDRKVGALMAALKRKHVLGKTIVVFASDNGFLWGEHRLGGKIWPYEESIRVPLVIRVPWRSAWGRTDSHVVLNIDFASTIAELAGVEPGLPQDGRSLVPLLRGRSPAWRRDFVVEYLGASELYDGGPPPFQALRSTRRLYVEYKNGWRELYDLRHDPYELRNLAGGRDVAALERSLSGRLRRLAR